MKEATKIAFYTLGCKVNQADSDSLASRLHAKGFAIVGPKDRADIYIVNTCTVTGKASYQSRQAIRRLIKKNPRAKVIVAGCDAEAEKETLQKMEGVSLVVDKTMSFESIISFLHRQESIIRHCEGHSDAAIQPDCHAGLQPARNNSDNPLILGLSKDAPFTSRSRPFLKIQDGCENFCSYCIVPYVRGGLKSMQPDEVIVNIKAIEEAGFYEIVLTGIHMGAYGRDLKNGSNLANMLERILKETNVPRIRLSSIDSNEIDEKLIDIVASSDGRIAPHMHIPLQSGSDETLKRMKRRYTLAEYRACIEMIKAKLPNVSIGADVITGFPEESSEEFNETQKFISSLPITYLHVFSYSDREGTYACKMENKINEKIKKERTIKLRNISTQKRQKYLNSNVGKSALVVFDKNKTNGYWKGISENYINVLAKDKPGSHNHYQVKLLELLDENMLGEVV